MHRNRRLHGVVPRNVHWNAAHGEALPLSLLLLFCLVFTIVAAHCPCGVFHLGGQIKENQPWNEITHWRKFEILALSRILTRARRPSPSVFCSTPACRTRSARCTKATPSWTGWSRSASAASQLPLRQQRRSGVRPICQRETPRENVVSTSFILQGTLTSRLK